jgi:hypothetical protein
VLQDFAEQEEQPAELEDRRLLPPPIPKEETSFWRFLAPQPGQRAPFSFPRPISNSHFRRQLGQKNS